MYLRMYVCTWKEMLFGENFKLQLYALSDTEQVGHPVFLVYRFDTLYQVYRVPWSVEFKAALNDVIDRVKGGGGGKGVIHSLLIIACLPPLEILYFSFWLNMNSIHIYYSSNTGEYHESVGLVFTRVPQVLA